MAGIQLGDVVSLSKVAWRVYEFGWREELSATRQYLEFGQDVRGVAQNLEILSQVIQKAGQSLRGQGIYNVPVRWDAQSVKDIVGDFDDTLEQCQQLLEENRRYGSSEGAARNIGWNLLVQPRVDQLRQRISMHNMKMQHFLKPFEIDLLDRIRQDIGQLQQSIHRVQCDLTRLIGVLVPDLARELQQQADQVIHTMHIPIHVADELQRQAMAEGVMDDDEQTLARFADAFILHFHNSTVSFEPGVMVQQKIPPDKQYLNLLKCVWLMHKLKEARPAQQQASANSHWRSYVRQLEEELSIECERCSRQMVPPDLSHLTPGMLTLWPERKPADLLEIVIKDPLMEMLQQVPLRSTSVSVDKKLQLLRHVGATSTTFRVVVSATEHLKDGKRRQEVDKEDFDISSALVQPLYAVPGPVVGAPDMILQKETKIRRFAFQTLEDVLKFQQGITGFKAWANYSARDVKVSFVASRLKKTITEEATVQLWVPKKIEGRPFRNTSDADSAGMAIPFGPGILQASTFSSSIPSGADPFSANLDPFSNPFQKAGPTGTSFETGRRQTMDSPSAGAPRYGNNPPTPDTSPRMRPDWILAPRSQSPPGRASKTRNLSMPSTAHCHGRSSSYASLTSASLSTHASTSAMLSSSSEGSSTVTLSLGGATGHLHRKPPRPMLVLFTRPGASAAGGQRPAAIVTIQLDGTTAANPQRCNCRRSGSGGATCRITAVESSRGSTSLEVNRYEAATSGCDVSLLSLALQEERRPGPQAADNVWADLRLNRISLEFASARDRQRFAGTPSTCRCDVRREVGLAACLWDGHQGLLGEVKEYYRRQLNDYHRTRHDAQRHVVHEEI